MSRVCNRSYENVTNAAIVCGFAGVSAFPPAFLLSRKQRDACALATNLPKSVEIVRTRGSGLE
ncbi:unnamed protein product [Ixodes persulcatus]